MDKDLIRCEPTITVDKIKNSKSKSVSSSVKKKATLISKYGIGFFIFNLILKCIWLGLVYLIIVFGVDVVSLFKYFGWDSIASFFQDSPAGEIGIAYVVIEIFKPVRIGISIAIFPFVCYWFKKFRKNKT